MPEPSIDGQTTTYHLREQSFHASRQYSKFLKNNPFNTNTISNNATSSNNTTANYHQGQSFANYTNPSATTSATHSQFAMPAGTGHSNAQDSMTTLQQQQKQQHFRQSHNTTSIYGSPQAPHTNGSFMDYNQNSNNGYFLTPAIPSSSSSAQQQQYQPQSQQQQQQDLLHHHQLSSTQLFNCPPHTSDFLYTPQAGFFSHFFFLFHNFH